MANKKAKPRSNCERETQSDTSQNDKSSIKLLDKIEWQIENAHYRIDRHGASYTAPTKNPLVRHSEEIGSLMTTYGLVKGSPGITTVGSTTMSQQNRGEKGWDVHWKDIREVKLDAEKHVVMLKEKLFTGGLGGGLGTRYIHCTIENYETVVSACQAFQRCTPKQKNRRSKPSTQ